MDKVKKIKQLQNALKLQVDDEGKILKDFESIIEMFDKIKSVDTEGFESSLEKKKISINDLRDDESVDSSFRNDLKGKYIEVPSVSKKDK